MRNKLLKVGKQDNSFNPNGTYVEYPLLGINNKDTFRFILHQSQYTSSVTISNPSKNEVYPFLHQTLPDGSVQTFGRSRGINFVYFNPQTEELSQRKQFDTYGFSQTTEYLPSQIEQYLDTIPQGSYIFLYTWDEFRNLNGNVIYKNQLDNILSIKLKIPQIYDIYLPESSTGNEGMQRSQLQQIIYKKDQNNYQLINYQYSPYRDVGNIQEQCHLVYYYNRKLKQMIPFGDKPINIINGDTPNNVYYTKQSPEINFFDYYSFTNPMLWTVEHNINTYNLVTVSDNYIERIRLTLTDIGTENVTKTIKLRYNIPIMVDRQGYREYYQKVTVNGNDKLINSNAKISIGFEYLDQNKDNSHTHNNNTNGDIENWILQKDYNLNFQDIPEGFEIETPIKGYSSSTTSINTFDYTTVYMRPVIKIEIDQQDQKQLNVNGQILDIIDFQIYYKVTHQLGYGDLTMNLLYDYEKVTIPEYSYDFQRFSSTSHLMYPSYHINYDLINSDYSLVLTTYNKDDQGSFEIFSLGQKGITGVDSIVVGYVKDNTTPSNSYIYIRQYKDNTLIREQKTTDYNLVNDSLINWNKLTWILTHKKVQGQHQYTLYVYNKYFEYSILTLNVDDTEINNNFTYNTNQTNLKTGYNFTQNLNINYLPDNSIQNKTMTGVTYFDELYLFDYIPTDIENTFIKLIYGYKFIVTSKGDVLQQEFEFTDDIPETTFKLSDNKLKIGLNITEGI